MQTDLLIVGAGPAGLAHAYWRKQADDGLGILVVDRQPSPGGWVQTRVIDGYQCEEGPQGIRPNDASDELIASLGIGELVRPASDQAKLRFVGRNGTLHALPTGPGGLVRTDLFSVCGKLRLFMEPFYSRGKDPEESLASFVGRRFGPQTIPMAESLASGVYGGDAHALEMAAAFPKATGLELNHGSILRGMIAKRKQARGKPRRPALCSFAGGMATLIEELTKSVQDSMFLSCEVLAVEFENDRWSVQLEGDGPSEIQTRELVLAIPSSSAARILTGIDTELAKSLAAIPYASIANVFLGLTRSETKEDPSGFGFLLDRREQSPMLGAIYCSSLFPDAAPPGHALVRVMAGGVCRPDVTDWPDERLTNEAAEMLRKYTGRAADIGFCHVSRALNAIPQYIKGHKARVCSIRELTRRHPGLALVGNSYDEVSVVGQLRRPTRD